MSLDIKSKTPEELKKVIADYEELVSKLFFLVEEKLDGVKKKGIANKLDKDVATVHHYKAGEPTWNQKTIKRALTLIENYEVIKKDMYDYLTKDHLTDLQISQIAKLLGYEYEEFRRTKHEPNSWSHKTLVMALELATDWKKA